MSLLSPPLALCLLMGLTAQVHAAGVPEEAAATVEVAESPSPALTRRASAKIYAVGSSTMAGLAFVMRKELQAKGFLFKSGAKPSSGLSRPDFYDWPAQIPHIIASFDPDIFIVSLGTNDGQALRLPDSSWVRPTQDAWEPVYRERVRHLLTLMTADRPRTIIWIGPNALKKRKKKPSTRARISTMMRDEIQRFHGDATYIDLHHLVTRANGRLRRFVTRLSDGRHFLARAKDGVHLSLPGLRHFLADRVFALLASHGKDPSPPAVSSE